MKILLITARSDKGGGPQHIWQLLQSDLLKTENSFFIAAPENGEMYSPYCRMTQGHFAIPHRRFSIITALKLVVFCRQNSIEIVHSHGRGAGAYSRFLALFGLKVIHTFHGVALNNKVKIFAEKMMKYLTKTFICVSESEKITALELGVAHKSQIIVIPNATSFNKAISKEGNPGVLTFGMLARFDPVKGHHLLIKSLIYLKELQPEFSWHCVLAGDGPELQSVKTECQRFGLTNQVQFLGEISEPNSFFSQIDIFISYSQSEGLPLALLEAMACAKKCLVSSIPAHREVLEDNPLLLFDRTNKEDFISKLQALTEHDDIGVKLQQRARSSYSLENMYQKTFYAYQGITPS